MPPNPSGPRLTTAGRPESEALHERYMQRLRAENLAAMKPAPGREREHAKAVAATAERIAVLDAELDDCEHESLIGVDQAPFGPEKVWRCCACERLVRTVPHPEYPGYEMTVIVDDEGGTR